MEEKQLKSSNYSIALRSQAASYLFRKTRKKHSPQDIDYFLDQMAELGRLFQKNFERFEDDS